VSGGEAFNLDGLRANAPVTADIGVINEETIFEFSQDGPIVEARYAGGRVKTGRLIGIIEGDTLEFRYAQVHTDCGLAGGHSRCELRRDERGRIEIVERFEWAPGGSAGDGAGENIIREL